MGFFQFVNDVKIGKKPNNGKILKNPKGITIGIQEAANGAKIKLADTLPVPTRAVKLLLLSNFD